MEVTGSALWDAGLALGAYCEKLRPELHADRGGADGEGLSAIEIGAGCGAAGLMMAVGGDEVVLTDNQPEVLALLETNIKRNRLQGCASVQALDWNDAPSLAVARRPWDLILCADIVYGLPSFTPLLQLLEMLCKGPHTRVLLACGNKQRGSREDLKFLAEMRQRGALAVSKTTEVEGAGVGRWGGGVVEVIELRRVAAGDGAGEEGSDDEFDELMAELDLEEEQELELEKADADKAAEKVQKEISRQRPGEGEEESG